MKKKTILKTNKNSKKKIYLKTHQLLNSYENYHNTLKK
jgi:hypothetical protein